MWRHNVVSLLPILAIYSHRSRSRAEDLICFSARGNNRIHVKARRKCWETRWKQGETRGNKRKQEGNMGKHGETRENNSYEEARGSKGKQWYKQEWNALRLNLPFQLWEVLLVTGLPCYWQRTLGLQVIEIHLIILKHIETHLLPQVYNTLKSNLYTECRQRSNFKKYAHPSTHVQL